MEAEYRVEENVTRSIYRSRIQHPLGRYAGVEGHRIYTRGG
jgi:hypothetical protein